MNCFFIVFFFKIDITQNERQIKLNDYTFSQKSDNTIGNNYTNSVTHFLINNKSNGLRNLVEENKNRYKILKNGKIHSYSPKIKYNFSFINNNKNNNNYFIYKDNKTTIIKNVIPNINLISEDITHNTHTINYYNSLSHSAKLFHDKKYKKKKKNGINKRHLIKEVKFRNNSEPKFYDYNNNNKNFNTNKIYKNIINNINKENIKINSLTDNINLKLSYNLDKKKFILNNNNNNKTFDIIMPPNDLSNIYKKNLSFNQFSNA